jgi:hypothetical protein
MLLTTGTISAVFENRKMFKSHNTVEIKYFSSYFCLYLHIEGSEGSEGTKGKKQSIIHLIHHEVLIPYQPLS